MSAATNLVPGVTRGFIEIYVHDLASDTTEVASIASDGTSANSSSSDPAFSADGRFVAFAAPPAPSCRTTTTACRTSSSTTG